jgi:hypothetical protein
MSTALCARISAPPDATSTQSRKCPSSRALRRFVAQWPSQSTSEGRSAEAPPRWLLEAAGLLSDDESEPRLRLALPRVAGISLREQNPGFSKKSHRPAHRPPATAGDRIQIDLSWLRAAVLQNTSRAPQAQSTS